MRVLLIAGGWSSEREVSLSGAKFVEASLIRLGHDVTLYDPAPAAPFATCTAPGSAASKLAHAGPTPPNPLCTLLNLAAKHDFAFIMLHGSPGEDGLIQAMLESVACPYQGSNPRGSFLALHKAAAKSIFRKKDILTPDWEFLPSRPSGAAHLDSPASPCSPARQDSPCSQWQTKLPYPVFAKSNTGGSSLHLYKAHNEQELLSALSTLFDAGNEVILETFVEGKEVTCAVLGGEALPPILIEPLRGAFFDYESKYQKGGAREVCPAPLPEQILQRVKDTALAAHKALGLDDYSRADFILTPQEELYLLEVNTLPGMTGTSLLPQAAAVAGMDFDALVEKLIRLGSQKASCS